MPSNKTLTHIHHLWQRLSIEHKLAIAVSLLFVTIMMISVYIGYEENKSRYSHRLTQYGKIISNLVEQNRSSMMEHGITSSNVVKKTTNISKTPSYLLNDISLNELAGIYRFISLTPLNKENLPDEFETKALISFEKGENANAATIIKIDGLPYYRFVQPLYFHSSCLSCHAAENKDTNGLRGAISLTFPIQNEEVTFINNVRNKIVVTVLLFILLFTSVIIIVRRLIIRPLDNLESMSEQIGSGSLIVNYIHDAKSRDQITHVREALINSDKRIAKQKDELKHLADLAERDSRIDPLTGAYNRRHLKIEAHKLFLQAQRKNEPISSVMIDIDHFKRVNDTYGHAIGDECIKLLSSTIKEHIRPYDMFVRLGGEEFLLLMPNTLIEQSEQIAERLRQAFEMSSLHSAQYGKITATISLGVYCSYTTSLEQAIAYADQALYNAKQNGRNQTQVLSDEHIY